MVTALNDDINNWIQILILKIAFKFFNKNVVAVIAKIQFSGQVWFLIVAKIELPLYQQNC